MQNTDGYHSILVGDDGSPEAKRAVNTAFSLAKRHSAKLTLICVKTPPSASQQAEGYGLEELERRQSQLHAELERSATSGRQQGIDVATAVVNGWEPTKEIEQYVETNGVDLFVVGHRKVSRVRYLLEGSASEKLLRHLLRHSSASILIVQKGK
jgi:nucleotide-binding universal stress UspA family protein